MRKPKDDEVVMNKRVKARWIRALRSGRYQQGRRKLAYAVKDGTFRFCCLGVLCDIAAKDGVVAWENPKGTANLHIDNCGGILPQSVIMWAGLKTGLFRGDENNPVLDANNEWTASDLNDEMDLDFKRIADAIQQHVIGA